MEGNLGVNLKYIYSDLTYSIIKCAQNVHNKFGGSLREKTYQRFLCKEFEKAKLKYSSQLKLKIEYEGMVVYRYLDFLVENKVIIELKVGKFISHNDYDQLKEYLKIAKIKLGLLILFTNEQVISKRVANIY